ncbi:DUF6572 domain-containing protein [Caballeronia sp. Lep1P3]|uniref:DUF6572 domain-containing protein n=1 Tax=Caballeronia sp. Lep1P3 TaxID=2878150 RepID=UPI001FD0437C|nr:DUF6572 domain-containing protein [Caballeronia sp. Lep1P3]
MTMSLRDVDAIDYIGVNILFKQVYVGVFDDMDWNDEERHQELLTKKIDRYTRYIRSGELLAHYPHVRGYQIVIEYVSMHAMTASAAAFWRTRERVIRAAGFSVRTRGVDVRRSLGLKVEEPVEFTVEEEVAELVEPPALGVLDVLDVLEARRVPDGQPERKLAEVTDISSLPPLVSQQRHAKTLPILTRLSLRRAAMM